MRWSSTMQGEGPEVPRVRAPRFPAARLKMSRRVLDSRGLPARIRCSSQVEAPVTASAATSLGGPGVAAAVLPCCSQSRTRGMLPHLERGSSGCTPALATAVADRGFARRLGQRRPPITLLLFRRPTPRRSSAAPGRTGGSNSRSRCPFSKRTVAVGQTAIPRCGARWKASLRHGTSLAHGRPGLAIGRRRGPPSPRARREMVGDRLEKGGESKVRAPLRASAATPVET
mmetsp:Transcript_85567/g.238869  ORF Transcript_85567/g.238869 Transcript_85567/m.238869 type:complete len:229 (+) Transcript_85567:1239-1925(+)